MVSKQKRKIETLPSLDELKEFEKLISNKSTLEGKMQKFIDEHPSVLVPLELSEFVRHLPYPKRNIKNPSSPSSRNKNRIPDFDGITLEGLAYPVIIEAKGPNDDILDSDGSLSDKSRDVLDQLIKAARHMLRPEGQEVRETLFDKPLSEILEENILLDFKELDSSNLPDLGNAVMIDIMEELKMQGCGFFALIGQSTEFQENSDLFEYAQQHYSSQGSVLLTYDELLLMNKVILDYISSNQSIYTFFESGLWKRSSIGTFYKQNASLLLTDELKKELQNTLYSISSDICFYGFGAPPNPTQTGEKEWAVLEAATSFNIGMLWARPTYLKGDERLLWAGKYKDMWVVVKERLTDPLLGGVIWYIFQPPSEKEPLI